MSIGESFEQRAAQFTERYKPVYQQISRVIVGHDDIVHGILTCLFVGGHCLLEGVPGLGKPLLVRTLAQTLDLDFSRIQFTPDLMPADILGTNMIIEDQFFFAVHVSQDYPFAKKIADGYYKVEVSNKPESGSHLHSTDNLLSNKAFIEAMNKTPRKPSFFEQRAMKHKNFVSTD